MVVGVNSVDVVESGTMLPILASWFISSLWLVCWLSSIRFKMSSISLSVNIMSFFILSMSFGALLPTFCNAASSSLSEVIG